MKGSNKSVISGIMLTAGSAIGAGMFSLPIVSSGMWFTLSIICFLFIWLISYLGALMILEVNLQYPVGSSFNTFVTDLLGKTGSIIFTLCICFILYILLYAYFSAFGNMAAHTLSIENPSSWVQGGLGLLLGLGFAIAVWISTSFTGRIASILVVAMAISFVIASVGALSNISFSLLWNIEASYMQYMWSGLPYFITSFGFASIVPSLYKHYGKDVRKIKAGLFYGSIIALVTYVLWLMISFGNIPREEFIAINLSGGNAGDLTKAIEQKIGNLSIQKALNFFSNFAIISSFLGVGLSLFDYIADHLNMSNNKEGRFLTTCMTFLPPGICSLFFPHGFIAAIGYAGFVLYIGFFLIPFFLIWKSRKTEKALLYTLSGGKAVLIFVFVLSTITAVCHVLAKSNLLPTY